jgi:hypothetical protein
VLGVWLFGGALLAERWLRADDDPPPPPPPDWVTPSRGLGRLGGALAAPTLGPVRCFPLFLPFEYLPPDFGPPPPLPSVGSAAASVLWFVFGVLTFPGPLESGPRPSPVETMRGLGPARRPGFVGFAVAVSVFLEQV